MSQETEVARESQREPERACNKEPERELGLSGSLFIALWFSLALSGSLLLPIRWIGWYNFKLSGCMSAVQEYTHDKNTT